MEQVTLEAIYSKLIELSNEVKELKEDIEILKENIKEPSEHGYCIIDGCIEIKYGPQYCKYHTSKDRKCFRCKLSDPGDYCYYCER
jgi:hypothetical protein